MPVTAAARVMLPLSTICTKYFRRRLSTDRPPLGESQRREQQRARAHDGGDKPNRRRKRAALLQNDADHVRPGETADVADEIDESDACGSGRAMEKGRGDGPEHALRATQSHATDKQQQQ